MTPEFIELIKMVPQAFAALFPVINPLGTAIILLGMTGALDKSTRRFVATKIAINTFVVLTTVLLAGSYLLACFGLTIPIVQAAGGLVLASMGWNMLKQDDKAPEPESPAALPPRTALTDRIFYPFTFPITVGPGAVAVTLTLSAHSQRDTLATSIAHQGGAIIGIAAVCALTYISFANSDLLTRRLGASGIKVLMRLMAFIIVCLGAQIFWNGASTLLSGKF